MDENLHFYGIQFKNNRKFEDRYRLFTSKELRDQEYVLITSRQDQEALDSVSKVEFTARVETEYYDGN